MKKQDFIKTIADALKVDAELLATELKKEDNISFELPKLKSYSEEEFTQLENNLEKVGYDKGVTVGFDKSAKKIKEVSGVEIEGKDISKIAEAIVAKANKDAKVEPNAKIEELTISNTKLRETVTDLEKEKSDAISNFDSYKKKQSLLSEIPANTVGLSNETVLSEMKANGFDFTEEGVTKNGELLKDDKLQNPLKRSDVFNQFLTEKKWLKINKSGRDGGDEGNHGNHSEIKTMEDYQSYCEKSNINPLSEEGKAVLIEARKENNF